MLAEDVAAAHEPSTAELKAWFNQSTKLFEEPARVIDLQMFFADVTAPEQRGAAYGLRQSMDTVGAFAGPLIAIGESRPLDPTWVRVTVIGVLFMMLLISPILAVISILSVPLSVLITVLIAVPVLLVCSLVEVYVWPHILEAVSPVA